MHVSWHKGSAYAWQKLVCNDAKVRWLLASTMYTRPSSQVGMREEKPPLKLHYRLRFLPGYRKLEWTLAYRSCGTKERERLRWTPSYANSSKLNGVGGDETSLSGGPRERTGRMTFHVFHDVVRILPAGLCKGGREIWLANLGGGGRGAREGWRGPHHIFRPNWEKWLA